MSLNTKFPALFWSKIPQKSHLIIKKKHGQAFVARTKHGHFLEHICGRRAQGGLLSLCPV